MPAVFSLLLPDALSTGTTRFLPANRLTADALGWPHTVGDFNLVASLVLLLAFFSERLPLLALNWKAAVALGL